MNLRFKVAYEGTRYSGWQRQGNTGNTIQAKLTEVLSRYFGIEVEIHASGRTDAGVHAAGQVFNVKLKEADPSRLSRYLKELNAYLPEDIRLLEITEAGPRFHSRLNSRWKTYRYLIYTGVSDPFDRRLSFFWEEALAVTPMQKAASLLTGTHDYLGFSSVKPGKRSTVRTVYEIAIDVSAPHPGQQRMELTFSGDGFLYHMVRYLAGTLIEAGQGRRSPESVKELLLSKDKDAASFLAPPEGLCLMDVHYEPWPE